MNLSILLLVLGIIYIYLSFVKTNNEPFENKIKKATTLKKTIFDEFYTFYWMIYFTIRVL